MFQRLHVLCHGIGLVTALLTRCNEFVRDVQRGQYRDAIKAARARGALDLAHLAVEIRGSGDEARPLLNDLIFRRCRHVITEIERCVQFGKLLRESRYDEAGELMVQSHDSLRDDYEVSVEPLDFLADQAMKIKGVYGSRMTGAGFGGCTVSLVQPRAVDAFSETIRAVYQAKYKKDPQVIVTTATDGARVV